MGPFASFLAAIEEETSDMRIRDRIKELRRVPARREAGREKAPASGAPSRWRNRGRIKNRIGHP